MNYIDITQPNQTLKLNLNYNGDIVYNDIEVRVYKDGSDTLVCAFVTQISDFKYYQKITIDSDSVSLLEDETQYSLETVDFDDNEKVIYRGKFQTTSKDLNNLSVNEGQYIKKTTATNYTILD